MDVQAVDFNDPEQREQYFQAMFDAEMAEAAAKQKQRYHLLYLESAILDALVTARLRKHFTQEQLANLLGVSRMTISRIEAGKHSPSLRMLLDVANILDIGVSLLQKPGE